MKSRMQAEMKTKWSSSLGPAQKWMAYSLYILGWWWCMVELFSITMCIISMFLLSPARLRATPASESGQTLPGLGTSGACDHWPGPGRGGGGCTRGQDPSFIVLYIIMSENVSNEIEFQRLTCLSNTTRLFQFPMRELLKIINLEAREQPVIH